MAAELLREEELRRLAAERRDKAERRLAELQAVAVAQPGATAGALSTPPPVAVLVTS